MKNKFLKPHCLVILVSFEHYHFNIRNNSSLKNNKLNYSLSNYVFTRKYSLVELSFSFVSPVQA